MNAAHDMIRRRDEGMQYLLPGAVLERKGRRWTVVKRQPLDGAVAITLQHGRRQFRLVVRLWIGDPDFGGPDWSLTGFAPVSPPPSQIKLFAEV